MAELRLMTPADGEWALAQMAHERWSSYPGWIRAHLGHDPDGCFIAEVEGEPVGMVTTTAFARGGWIGNLIVTPGHRRHGLGTLLMQRGLDRLHAAGLATVRIDADPPGMGIYRRLGFVESCESLRFWTRDLRGRPHAGVRPLAAGDLDRIAVFDRERFGDDRSRFLHLIAEVSSLGFVLEDLSGFTFVIPTQDGAQLGPTVAASVTAARALLETAKHAAGATALVTGLPASNHAGVALLRDLGFREGAPCRRMFRGDAAEAGDPSAIFAIASGACG